MRSLVVTVVIGSGCYAPQVANNIPCGDDEVCPQGQMCSQGLCRTMASDVPDAATDGQSIDASADAAADAAHDGPPPIDAPPVPAMMKFGDRSGAIAGTLVDTFLPSWASTSNLGSHPDLHLTGGPIDPILIRVDVSMVPSHATVTSARLKLYVQTDSIPSGTKVRIFEMNESWTEGNLDNDAGVANQTHRNPGVLWSAASANPPSRDSNPITVVTASSNIGIGSEITLDLPTAVVASWVSSPNTNFGLAMFVEGAGFYCEVGSTEAGDAMERPVLELSLQ